MENKDWKEQLRNYAPEVDDQAWNTIEPRLPKGAKNYKGLSLSLLALLLVSTASFFYFDTPKASNVETQSKSAAPTSTAIAEIKEIPNKLHLADKITNQSNVGKENATKKLTTKKRIVTHDSQEKSNSTIDQTVESKKLSETEKVKSPANAVLLDESAPLNSEEQTQQSLNIAFNTDALDKENSLGTNTIKPNYSIKLTSKFKKLKPMGIKDQRFNYYFNDPQSVAIQQKEVVKKERPKQAWDLYINSQLFSAYHKINPNLLDEKVITSIDNPAFSMDRLGYKLSFGASKNVAEKLQLYTGLSYLYQSQTIKYSYITTQNNALNIAAPQAGTLKIKPEKSHLEENVQVTNQSYGLHLGLRYTLVERGPFEQALDLQLDWQKQIGDQKFYGSNQYYVNLAFNNQYHLNNWLSFKLAPVISYTVREYAGQSTDSFSLKPYSLGLDIGLVIHINR